MAERPAYEREADHAMKAVRKNTPIGFWSALHSREAHAREHQLEAELVLTYKQEPRYCASAPSTEAAFRDWMKDAGLDADRVAREVRRVDALATGRLVRVMLCKYVVDRGTYTEEHLLPEDARPPKGGRLVRRITRIRLAKKKGKRSGPHGRVGGGEASRSVRVSQRR
jgi:hypothetical protein